VAKYVNCPECGTKNPVSADAAQSKIDCSECGMLLVLKKLEIMDEKPAAPARTRRTTSGSSRSRRNRAAEAAEEKEEAAPSRGGRRASKTSSRRSTRGGGGRRRVAPVEEEPAPERIGGRAMRKPKNDMPAWAMAASGLGLVVLVGAAVYFLNQGDSSEAEGDDKTKTTATAQADAEESRVTDEVSEPATADKGGAETTAAVSEEKPAKPAPAKKKPAKKASGKWAFTEFTKPDDVSDEDFAKAVAYIATLTDPNETRKAGQASRALINMPRAGVPALINTLGSLKRDDKDDVYKGQQIISTLEQTVKGATDFWENDSWSIAQWVADPSSREAKDSFLTRKQAVKKWAQWWEKVGADWKPKVESEDDW
jgi:DNA-directed RNA polymerase subunit RPC12/RpoP